VASGIGNVYKSEVLFLEKVHPWRTVASLGDDTAERLYRRAHRLLAANARPGPRSTTGNRRQELHWVYGRTGEPCRRCGSTIEEGRHGELSRITTWCPTCQPESSTAVPPAAGRAG
jgi:endonuclease-8